MTLPQATQLQIESRQPTAAEILAYAASRQNKWFSPRPAPRKSEAAEAVKTGCRHHEQQPAPPAAEKPKITKLPRDARYRMVASLLRQGVIQERIYEMTGVSRKKIRNVALSLGLPTDSRQFCDRHEAEIRRMYDEGMSLISISLSLGMAKNSAANYVRKKGWKR
jgi:hypothetical protein